MTLKLAMKEWVFFHRSQAPTLLRSTLFPRPRTEKVALVGERKSQKSPHSPLWKRGAEGGFIANARDYSFLPIPPSAGLVLVWR
jgi:hypothetical protein